MTNLLLALAFWGSIGFANENSCNNLLAHIEHTLAANHAGVVNLSLMPRNARERLLLKQYPVFTSYLADAFPNFSEIVSGQKALTEEDLKKFLKEISRAATEVFGHSSVLSRFLMDFSDLMILNERRSYDLLVKQSDRLLPEYGVRQLKSISQLDSAKTNLIFFSKRPCLPCEELKPDFARLAPFFESKGMDVWLTDDVSLGKHFGVSTFPSFVATHNGKHALGIPVINSTTTLKGSLESLASVVDQVDQSVVVLFDPHQRGFKAYSYEGAAEAQLLWFTGITGRPIAKKPVLSLPKQFETFNGELQRLLAKNEIAEAMANPFYEPTKLRFGSQVGQRHPLRPGRVNMLLVSSYECAECDPLLPPSLELANLLNGHADLYYSTNSTLAQGFALNRLPTVIVRSAFCEIIGVSPYETTEQLYQMLLAMIQKVGSFSGQGFYVNGKILRLVGHIPKANLEQRLQAFDGTDPLLWEID